MRLSWVLALTLTGCSAPSRHPSGEPVNACESMFTQRLGRGSDEIVNDLAEYATVAEGSLQYLIKKSIPEWKSRLEHSAELIACERQLEVSDLARDLEVRYEIVSLARAKWIMNEDIGRSIETSAFLNDPQYPQRVACAAACQDPRCQAKCGFTPDQDAMARRMRIYDLIQSCSEAQTGKFHADEFEKSYRKFVPEIRRAMVATVGQVNAVAAGLATAHPQLNDLFKKARAASAKWKVRSACKAPPLPAWSASLWKSVALLGDDKLHGTGFWITAGGRTRLASAYHVYEAKDPVNFGQGTYALNYASGTNQKTKPAKRNVTFLPAPGLVHRSGDVMLAAAEFSGPKLTVVEKDRLPRKGQRFYIAGFPSAAGNEARIYPCTFAGYARAKPKGSVALANVYDCQGMDGVVTGMSGGPILDEGGAVWAVVSNNVDLTGQVIGAPISVKDGEIHFGYGGGQLTEDCLRERDWTETYRCQMIENPYEKTVP